jgi:hypothetical protein
MTAIHTWMAIAATILIGFVAGLSANAQDIRVRVSTKDSGTNYFAVTSDHRLVAIACNINVIKSTLKMSSDYSADLVFPTDAGVLDLERYRSNLGGRAYVAPQSAYRPLSSEDANDFCGDPQGDFVFRITDESAILVNRDSVNVKAFGVGRRSL